MYSTSFTISIIVSVSTLEVIILKIVYLFLLENI